MKEFKNLSLCDYRDDRIWINVRVSLLDGSLELSGHDLGKSVEEFWGDDDYEYWYRLSAGATQQLLHTIGGTNDPEKALRREFSGPDGCRKLRALCDAHGIRYEFFSYV